MALAISVLLLALKPDSRDYVYAAFFLVCATPLLKIRWLVGTALLAAPVALAAGVHFSARCGAAALAAGGAAAGEAACSSADAPGAGPLPLEAVIHLLVAWAVGGLMAFLSDTNRRQAFAHHALALAAAEKELAEMRARAGVERELAAAQAQVRARRGRAGVEWRGWPCVALRCAAPCWAGLCSVQPRNAQREMCAAPAGRGARAGGCA